MAAAGGQTSPANTQRLSHTAESLLTTEHSRPANRAARFDARRRAVKISLVLLKGNFRDKNQSRVPIRTASIFFLLLLFFSPFKDSFSLLCSVRFKWNRSSITSFSFFVLFSPFLSFFLQLLNYTLLVPVKIVIFSLSRGMKGPVSKNSARHRTRLSRARYNRHGGEKAVSRAEKLDFASRFLPGKNHSDLPGFSCPVWVWSWWNWTGVLAGDEGSFGNWSTDRTRTLVSD